MTRYSEIAVTLEVDLRTTTTSSSSRSSSTGFHNDDGRNASQRTYAWDPAIDTREHPMAFYWFSFFNVPGHRLSW